MNFRTRILFAITSALMATALFAHQGHEHKILGTVKTLHENHLVIERRDGVEKTVTLTAKTRITRGTETTDRSALAPGTRVSAEVDNDDNVLTLKLAPAK